MENYRLEQTGQEVQDILNGAAMQTDLTAEVERAEGAEQTLQGNIDEEERRAKAAEETLSGAIGDEELRAKAAEEALGGAIDGINAKIPAAASSENKLADQDFVNSSIETATATFRGTFNLVSDLHLAVDATHEQIATLLGTVIAEADKNDYSYVLVPTSAQTPTEIASIEKYTFGANGWAFAYALNNSGFTSAQWAAINSGITSGLVGKLNALPTNDELTLALAGKQDVLTFDNVPVEGSNNPVKSGGVHSAIDDEKTARVNAMNQLSGRVDTIEGEIPAQASSENQLADKAYVNSSISTNTATYRGSFNLVADLGLSVSATHEQIGTALAGEISTADNNDYAYVQVPTSDETPSQILKVERYKFNGMAWAFEYELNNSGFTSAQWAALNSGITSGLVGKLNALPTNDELTLALAGKQDVLTFDNTPTENSNNPVKSGGVYAADKAMSDAIEAILLLIPSAATSLNKLVDTDLMNSSISTATATFRGTFNLVSDLSLDLTATHAQIATALAGEISTADNNDYCFVQIPTAIGTPTEIAQTDRYKFNGTAWAFEYTLNNSGFTAAQWAAINSAITTELVAKLTALPTNAELLESLGLLSSGISGINAKIPSAASSENKLVDGTAMETYVSLIIGQLDATFNVQSTDGHVILTITQVNGVITSVQLTTSDIASATALTLLAGRVTTAEGNITSLTGRMTTAESDIDTLTNLYNALQQSAPQVIQPTDTWPVANPSTTVIYRVIDRVNTPPEYYSDYMWSGTAFVLMATYNNAIDTTPQKDSANLVTSGGVFANIGAFDISEYHKLGSTLATYADLTAALAALPSDFQKGGMSIKYVQSSDNKYVSYRLKTTSFSANVYDWVICGGYKIIGSTKYILALTDEQDKILVCINREDGSVFFGAGCPPQIVEYIQNKCEDYDDVVTFVNGLEEGDKNLQQLLNEKVSKEAGKSLTDAVYASSQKSIGNAGWLRAETDNEGKLLGGRKADGTLVENMPIENPTIDGKVDKQDYPVVSPLDKGIAISGKGTEDDPYSSVDGTAGIGSALTLLTRGGKVRIPSARFNITSPIIINKRSIKIEGDSWNYSNDPNGVYSSGEGSKLAVSDDSNGIQINGASGLSVKEIGLQGIYTNGETKGTFGISTPTKNAGVISLSGRNDQMYLSRISCQGLSVGYCIITNGDIDASIFERLNADGCNIAFFFSPKQSYYANIRDNIFSDCPAFGIYIAKSTMSGAVNQQSITIDGNVCVRNGGGFSKDQLEQFDTDLIASMLVSDVYRSKIINNQIEDAGTYWNTTLRSSIGDLREYANQYDIVKVGGEVYETKDYIYDCHGLVLKGTTTIVSNNIVNGTKGGYAFKVVGNNNDIQNNNFSGDKGFDIEGSGNHFVNNRVSGNSVINGNNNFISNLMFGASNFTLTIESGDKNTIAFCVDKNGSYPNIIISSGTTNTRITGIPQQFITDNGTGTIIN